MPFRVVSGVGRGMAVSDWGGDRPREMGNFGVIWGRPIVTNGIRCVVVYERAPGDQVAV